MLSATSTQSPLAPVSSVFTMPSVSLPHASIAGTGALGLADQLFMSVPSVADTATTPSAADAKSDINGGLAVGFVDNDKDSLLMLAVCFSNRYPSQWPCCC